MSYPRLAARLYNVALLIEPGKAEVIEAVFRAYAEGRAESLPPYEAKPAGQPPVPMERTDNGYSLTTGGVAVLPVHGTLVQRGDSLDAMSGLTGYNVISRRLQAALADPKVKGIVLEFDSPGGEVAGVFELAGQIQAATKPVWAHANEMMFSAAYALGVGASDITMAQTSMVGSVGVIMLHVDQSQADAKKGFVYTPIYAGARKVDYSSHAPLSDQARATAQEQVDRLYQIFVDHVAEARAIDPAVVKATEAGLLTPGQALDTGMGDGQASLTETITRMQDEVAQPTFTGYSSNRPSRATSERSNTMSTEKDKAPGQATATEEQLKAAQAETEAAKTGTAKAVADARAAERARFSAITSHEEAKGREKLATHLATNTDMDVDAAVALLKASAKELPAAQADQFAAYMAKQGNAKVAADGGADPNAGKVTAPIAANVYAFRQKCVADSRKAS
jgi:signal peptide peptidase SppA